MAVIMSYNKLTSKIGEYLPSEKLLIINKAYEYAAEAHKNQLRKSGDPYIEHPLQVALILADLQLDSATLTAALLHDIPENCGIEINEIEKIFGQEIGKLVDGVTRLGKLSLPKEGTGLRTLQAQNLRKMLVAMAEDLRVVFIKLADRLHNMRTLDALSVDKQRNIAQETLEIYAPLAHRLGIWELKWQLEDLSFRYLESHKYNRIINLVNSKRAKRENIISRVVKTLNREFEQVGLRADVSGRPKHFYSIFNKIERYAAQGKNFNDIHDLLAFRILVNTISDCYRALGVIHGLWRPLPDEFDDYIANPKPNGYQSLHTTVIFQGTMPLEIQIRTREMHYVTEYGVAAHWHYKEGAKRDIRFEDRIGWLRQLIDWRRELSGAEEFLESVKTDIFIDQVFVFTPKGEIKELPKDSTPLDFAYRVHTDLGHHCVGAKVNGRLVALNTPLNNGDVVEIMITKSTKGPSRDWLNPNLGYVKTSHAREKIRQWFKKQEKVDNIERGRSLLEKEFQRLGLKLGDREELAKLFNYTTVDDFLAAIGYGGITARQIITKISAQHEPPKITDIVPPKPSDTTAIRVRGIDNILTKIAKCCQPVPGDRIIGYITRSRGVTIHRQDCYNIIHTDERERLIPTEWGQTDSFFQVNIQVNAWDRVGLLRDISTIVASEKMNITAVRLVNNDDHTVTTFFTLETKGLTQLSRMMGKIEGVRGVRSVTRVGDEMTSRTG